MRLCSTSVSETPTSWASTRTDLVPCSLAAFNYGPPFTAAEDRILLQMRTGGSPLRDIDKALVRRRNSARARLAELSTNLDVIACASLPSSCTQVLALLSPQVHSADVYRCSAFDDARCRAPARRPVGRRTVGARSSSSFPHARPRRPARRPRTTA